MSVSMYNESSGLLGYIELYPKYNISLPLPYHGKEHVCLLTTTSKSILLAADKHHIFLLLLFFLRTQTILRDQMEGIY